MRCRSIVPLIVLAACGGSPTASTLARPPEYPTDRETRCGVVRSQSEPLVVEWPDAARGKLESLRRQGMVAVRYQGCELKLLQCRGKSSYQYVPLTRKQNRLTIRNDDELYANFPVGAVSLEGKLKRAGQLNVEMTLVGRYELAEARASRDELEGVDCPEATHLVSAMTVGAFTFSAGAEATVGAGARVLGVGEGVSSGAMNELLQRDGEESACERSTGSDAAPPDGCGALIRLEVAPLAPAARRIAYQPPPDAPIRCGEGHHLESGVCVDDERPIADRPAASLPPLHSAPAQPAVSSRAATAPSTATKPIQDPWHIAFAWGAVGGFLTAAVAGVVASSQASYVTDSQKGLCNPETKFCSEEGLSKRDAAMTWAWVSTAGLGVGVGATLLYYLVPRPQAPVTVGVAPVPGGASVGAQGSF